MSCYPSLQAPPSKRVLARQTPQPIITSSSQARFLQGLSERIELLSLEEESLRQLMAISSRL
ncbi:MAG: hypothetical protein KC462_03325 [Cyanobacteria bacterium HKST-UBA05]|nr:hypothetical protein [Cyanobacteria bacterium HKST-UBA05]